MVSETIQQLVSRLDTMTNAQRERVLDALVSRYCVCCGAKGDWNKSMCECEPEARPKDEPDTQLWLVYHEVCAKAA